MHRFTPFLRFRIIFICALLALATSSLPAQSTTSSTDGSTPFGMSPGAPAGSYALSDLDTVNLYNGGLNFHLPLVKIAGRGGAGYTMVMRIEHKWLVHKEQELGVPNRYVPSGNWWDPVGFNVIYSMGRLDVRKAVSNEEPFIPSGCSSYIYRETLTRLTFTAPDGTEYELRDQLTNGRPDHPTCTTGFNRGRVFTTSDGSSATFVSDSDISDDPLRLEAEYYLFGYMTLRDGTRYRIEGGLVTSMRDRNGNELAFSYNGQTLTSVTDSLNRQITISWNENGGYTQIALKGFGGAQRILKVYQSYLQNCLRSDFSFQSFPQLFPELNGASSGVGPLAVTSAVELPNGQRYQFFYNSYYELARVVLPTGGAIEYDYAAGLTDGATSGVITVNSPYPGREVYRRVVERRVYPDGGSGAGYATRMTYSRPETTTSNLGYVTADQYDANGTLLSRSNHYFNGSPRASFSQQPTQYGGWKDGREYQTIVYAADGTTPLTQVVNTLAQRTPVSWWTGGADQEPPNDPRLVETDTTLMDTNQVTKQTSINPNDPNDKGFDQFNNQTDVWEYDYGVGSPGMVRHSHTTFLSASGYTVLGLLSLPSQVSVYDGGGTERARTTFEYDNYTTDTNHAALEPRASISALDPAFTTSYATRGNVTATTNYLLNSSGLVTGSISAYAQYDIAGNVVKAIDARGYETTFDYRDNFGGSDEAVESAGEPANVPPAGLAGQITYAFPFKVTNALGHTAYSKYDYNLGRAVAGEDANGIVSRGYFDDSLDRPTQVRRAVGTSIQSQTTFSYDDVNRIVTTTSDQNTFNDPNPLKSEVVYDGLGRTTEKRQYETANAFITVKQLYDALGRAYKVSNPYRSGDTVLWTTTSFDALSRVISVTTPDNALVTTAYSGNRVLVSDQVGKERISKSDGLGRLKDVWEITAADSATEGVAFPGHAEVTAGYHTSYEYDTLDNLTNVYQGSQTRTFAYDSLKRLLSATNPESGTVCYGTLSNNQCQANGYDASGNLVYKTDARGVVTSYGYDALNRNISVSYANDPANTPAVTRYYDSATNGKGRIYQTVTSGAKGTKVTINSYDALGRPLSLTEQIKRTGTFYGPAYNVQRTYDLAGHVLTQTYPSGHVVNYNYDLAGRLADKVPGSQTATDLAFSGNLGDGVKRAYASGISYDEASRMQEEKYGTMTPLYHKQRFNSRGQLWDMRLSTVSFASDPTNGDRGAIINYYSNNFQQGVSGTDNNGNLLRQETFIPGSDYFRQNYSYDSLNRLTSVSELKNGQTANFTQAYSFDRWGNRTIDQTGTTANAGINNLSCWIDPNTNRLHASSDQGINDPTQRLIRYDDAGNQTNDYYGPAWTGSRIYDAENRMISATNSATNTTSTYTYDGDGRRVRRIDPVVGEVWQVYGLDDELLAEYKVNGAAILPQKEYGYRNGQLLVTATNGDEQRLWNFMKNVAVRFGVYGSAVGDSQLLSAANALSTAGAQGQSQMLSAARTQVQNVIMWSNIASDTDYVTALYLSYLQRFPDADGLNAWVSEVPTIGRDSVRDGFAYSDEFAARVSNLRGTAASDTERTDAFVQYVYNGILHRSANGSEDATAISTLDNAGATGQANVIAAANDLARNLFNSSEYTSRSGLTPHDFVYDLYQTLYCSPPDNSWDYWTDQVGANWENKQAVLDHFINAGPFDQKAATLYREVLWLVPDQLGTPRMIAERTGSLAGIKRHDYLPFGEELFASTGGRTTAQGYVGDSTRQHFTGYERDLESGLDYAHARYYSSTQGRFTSADIPLMDQYKTNPQSWNLYTYVGNKPLTYTDPFGLWKRAQCENGVCWEAEKGDTYAGLAKILGVSAKALAKNFQNEKITVGHIFDVSGFFATNTPVAQTPRTYLEVIIWYPQPSAHHPLSLGHVSYNINGQSWSWERNGWHRDSAENFLKQNSYRDGRGYVLDDENDPSWAAEMADNIMSFHGDGNSLLPGLGPYGLIHDNCGEAFCRAANKMGLPQNDGVLPTDHASYILNKMRPYIKSINFYRHGAVESRPVRR